MKELSAQIYRNAIAHHRNQIRLVCQWVRDGSLHKPTGLKLAKSHADEIKRELACWRLSYPQK